MLAPDETPSYVRVLGYGARSARAERKVDDGILASIRLLEEDVGAVKAPVGGDRPRRGNGA